MPLKATALYIGDNGRVHCGALDCAGSCAHFGGVGLGDGMPVVELTAEVKAEAAKLYGSTTWRCESCGRTEGA